MIESRISCTRPILAAIAILLLTGCGDSVDPSPGKLQTEPQQVSRRLEQSQAALGAAEQRSAALREEQTQDRRRLAELAASTARLEQRNRELGQHLTRARGQLDRRATVEKSLRQQRDQNIRRVRELANERRTLHASLARANGEIRRLQAQQSPDQRRIADLHYRGAAAAREVDELRRYNGFLLQERGNLQAWLGEANATRKKQQDALQRAEQEVVRIKSTQSTADSANRKLRFQLDRTAGELTAAQKSRDALAEEIETLRTAATRIADTERGRSEHLEQALAHASSPGEAHEGATAELDGSAKADADTDAAMLRVELDEARDKVARLQVAKDYLVEKIEACTSQQQSSIAESMHLALIDKLMHSRVDDVTAQRARGRFMTAQWQTGPAVGIFAQPQLVPVAGEADDPAKATRHEKELKETRQKLEDLELSNAALSKSLQDLESECSTVRKQVETLTWANKELVKELDTAYQSREAGVVGRLPEGTRGIYILRKGESLSLVAKAFYGEPERWKDIVEANKEKIPNPDSVKAGTIILIPE